MTIWHERRGADLLLRSGGVMLLSGAWLLGTCLTALVRYHAPHNPSPLELLVGMVMFGAGSSGAAMLTLGRHLLNKVVISERWATRGSNNCR
jgi:hypothetical protein